MKATPGIIRSHERQPRRATVPMVDAPTVVWALCVGCLIGLWLSSCQHKARTGEARVSENSAR